MNDYDLAALESDMFFWYPGKEYTEHRMPDGRYSFVHPWDLEFRKREKEKDDD